MDTDRVAVAERVELLMDEYRPIAALVESLTLRLTAATIERNAVLAALSETGLRQVDICALTGLTISKLRTAVWNDWDRRRAPTTTPTTG